MSNRQHPQHSHHVQQRDASHDPLQSQHTLVLLQGSAKVTSKQYSEYDSIDDAMDGICSLYEYQLSRDPSAASQPQHLQHIQYDISDLFAFIDRLPDLAVLVYSHTLRAYEPHDKQWIKSQVYEHLKKQAGGE